MAIGNIRNIGGGKSSKPKFQVLSKISDVSVSTLTDTDLQFSGNVTTYSGISPRIWIVFTAEKEFTISILNNVGYGSEGERWQIRDANNALVYNSTSSGNVTVPKGTYTFQTIATRSFERRMYTSVVCH